LGCAYLAVDPRFETNPLRVKNREELHDLLQTILIDQNAEELSTRLLGSGIPASAILDVGQALAAPHTAHRSMIVEDADYKALGIPIKLSRTPGAVRTRPRELGADTREVCRSAGLEDTAIDEMVATGIIFEAQPPNPIAADKP